MQWLNYHHLFYFWMVAKEGSLALASQELKLAQPTVSAQIKAFEQSLGQKLFEKVGRKLILNEIGQVVFRYADDIFSLGREMVKHVSGQSKLIAYRLIEPALQLQPIQICCREDRMENLLADLTVHKVDLVLSELPMEPFYKVKAFHHLLGECGISFFGTQPMAKSLKKNFPHSLHQMPFLFPTENTSLRRNLEQWFQRQNIEPQLIGEFEDNALLQVFAQAGMGIFAGPTVIEKEICEQYRVHIIGRTTAITERFYAISADRKMKHPAVVAICEAARKKLFG